jgi:hypothetical protein
MVPYVAAIYLGGMPQVKTTVYLDAGEYRRLKALAAAQGRSAAELIRMAVAEYASRHAPRRMPASLGAARSGDGTLSERAEELLEGLGEDG